VALVFSVSPLKCVLKEWLCSCGLQVTFDFSNQQVILNVHYVVHHGNMAILNFTKQFAEKALSQRYQCPI